MDKQIDELKAILNRSCEEITGVAHFHGSECPLPCECDECTATNIYNAGWRRQDEVAREIFAELKTVMIDEYRYPIIAKLKKKYGVT